MNRRHECGPAYSDDIPLEVAHEGQPIRVLIPDNLNDPERLEIRATLRSESLFVLIGHHTMKGKNPYERGIFMIDRARDDGVYVVHVWHELYPWALPYLELGEVSDTI